MNTKNKNVAGIVLKLSLGLGLSVLSTMLFAQSTFTPLDTYNRYTFSEAYDVSADGSVITGIASYSAFRWTENGGMINLGRMFPNNYSIGLGISDDGAVIAGNNKSSSSSSTDLGYRWGFDTGMQQLGSHESDSVYDVSADGNVIVGRNYTTRQAYRWTVIGGMLDLGVTVPGSSSQSTAFAVSDDGSVVVGESLSDHIVGYRRTGEAFRWTAAGGIQGLGDFPGGYENSYSYANAVSADGQVVVGRGESDLGYSAFRWTETEGLVDLGVLPTTSTLFSEAFGVTADGSVVVGVSGHTSDQRAFIWDSVNGMRNLQSVLETDYALNLLGWTLKEASKISPDGNVIVGYGTNPQGRREAWRVQLVTPVANNTDVAVTASGPGVLNQNEGSVFNFTLTNNGTELAITPAVLIDLSGSGTITEISSDAVQCHTSGSIANCAILNLAPAAMATFSLTIAPNTAGPGTIQVAGSSRGVELTPADNQVTLAFDVKGTPQVTVLSPSSGTAFYQGDVVGINISATDLEDGDVSSSLQWASNLDGVIGSGVPFSISTLSLGYHRITATATDSDGNTGSGLVFVNIKVRPNSVPIIDISAPLNNASYTVDDMVALSASANDFEDGSLDSVIEWSSSIDGVLGTGATLTSALTEGTHVISASAIDSGNLTGSAEVTVNITPHVNVLPVVIIQTPLTGSRYLETDLIQLIASATDEEDGVLDAQISWTSSIDGILGQGASLSRNLSSGLHTITASVSDNNGGLAQQQISLTVEIVNTPPLLSILSPANASTINEDNNPLVISVSANDAHDGNLASQVVLQSSIDGVINSPAVLSVGTHIITATVTDSGGLQSSDSIVITITPHINIAPQVVFVAPANNSVFDEYFGAVSINVTATDLEDGNLTPLVALHSSIDGVISSPAMLSVGTHILTAGVTDSGGLSSVSNIIITVTPHINNAPQVAITQPVTSSLLDVYFGAVTVAATATDLEDGNLASQVVLESSIDGVITSPVVLSIGTHILTASVTDSGGLTATHSVTVTVIEHTNVAPQVTLSAPMNGQNFLSGQLVTFSALANDFEDGDLSTLIQWSSSLDGALGTGGQVTNNVLSQGTHVISATVTDSNARSSTASISIIVQSPTGSDFPEGGVLPANWVNAVNGWFVTSDYAYAGVNSLKSSVITHGQQASASMTANFDAGVVSFARKVSSEANYDYLRFYIDGVLQAQWAGELPWLVVSYNLSAGSHTLTWTYYKDGSVSRGLDAAWVDELSLPGSVVAPPPPTASEFPEGGVMPTGWVTPAGVTTGWTVTTLSAASGTSSLMSNNIADNQSSGIEVSKNFTAGTVRFKYKVSSEGNYDYLRFYIDGVEKSRWSGESGWAEVSYPVTAGNHTLKWAFTKDSSVSRGSDAAWIDDVVMP